MIKGKDVRRTYLAFEFEKDAQRRTTFIQQSLLYCDYVLEDLSLPSALHDSRWQRESRDRICQAEVLIVLLGQDTHSSHGVYDEISLAGQVRCPIVQLMPQRHRYGTISNRLPVLPYKWRKLNEMLQDPKAFVEG
jgi:hypothetical protein